MTNREAINIITAKMDVHQAVFGHPVDEPLKTAYETAISALEQQEQDRWIPVTERLPEEEGCYMVTIKNDHKRTYSKTAWYAGDGWFARQDIIAWRPLPEAYKAEEEA